MPRPAKPSTAACHSPPSAAMRTPPAMPRSCPPGRWRPSRGSSARPVSRSPSRAATMRVHGPTQRAAVAGARLVVAEVGRLHRAVEAVRQQRQQHDHVRLLDDLRRLRALAPEHDVHRHGPAGVLRQVDVLQVEVARELLDEPGRRDRSRSPVARPRRASARARRRRGQARRDSVRQRCWPALGEQCRDVQPALEVPLRHARWCRRCRRRPRGTRRGR